MIITVYGSTTCPVSAQLRDWLDEIGADYTGLLIDKNPHAANRLIQYIDQAEIPFTTIEHSDGRLETFAGFEPSVLKNALLGK